MNPSDVNSLLYVPVLGVDNDARLRFDELTEFVGTELVQHREGKAIPQSGIR